MKTIEKIKNYSNKVKTDNFWNNLFKNSFWAFSGESMAAVLSLIITVILIRLIGSEEYGILVLAQTYMSIIDVILNIQSWKSVIQYGQKSMVDQKYNELNGYVKLGSILDIFTAIIGGMVAILIAPIIGKMLNWSDNLILCAQIFSITIFSHFSGTPTAILRILNKFNLVAIQKFITALIKLCSFIIIFIVKKNVELVEATLIYCITDIIGNLLLIAFAFYEYKKKFPKTQIFKSKLPKDTKKFVKFTIWGTLNDVVDIPVSYFDVFILSFLGNDIVAVFKVFKQCVAILQKVTSPIQQSILPQFSEMYAKGEKKEGYKIVIKIRNIILKIIGPIALFLGLTSPIWLNIVYGELYAQNWYCLCLYLLIQTFALSYTTVHPYFLSLDKAKYSAIYILIANIIYMILALILVKLIGILGIILAYFAQCSIAIYLKIRNIKKENS